MSVDRPTLTTRATLFLRLNTTNATRHEIAWQEFHARYSPIIGGFARKMGAQQQHEIEDVIQDVMIGFFAHAPTFVYDPARGRFRGYLKVCTFRALRDRLRHRARFKTVPLDQLAEDDAGIEQVWDESWQHELLNRAVAAVRTTYANNNTFRAFTLHVLDDEPVDAVAAKLGMSVASVYKAKQRVTAAVQREFQALQEIEG